MLDQHKDIVDEIKVIVFRLVDEEYGVEVNQVRSIEKMQNITRVPRTPDFVKGVINLRGVVTPIIDLKTRFDLGEEGYTDSTRIIIVAVDDMEVGIKATYLRGVAKLQERLLIMLNLDKVLSNEEIQAMSSMER